MQGFFSTGRGEFGSWRSKANGTGSSAIVPADNARNDVVRKTVYITDVDQQVKALPMKLNGLYFGD